MSSPYSQVKSHSNHLRSVFRQRPSPRPAAKFSPPNCVTASNRWWGRSEYRCPECHMDWHGLPTSGDGNSSSSSIICQGGRVSFRCSGESEQETHGFKFLKRGWIMLNHLNRHLNRFGDLEGIRHKQRVHSRTSHQFSAAMAGAAALTMGVDDPTCMIHPLGFAHWLYNGYIYIYKYLNTSIHWYPLWKATTPTMAHSAYPLVNVYS